MLTELPEILIESALAYVFILLFFFTGRIFLVKTQLSFPGSDNKYGHAFYNLVFGLLITITMYSLIVAKGITVNLLMLPLLALLIWKRDRATVIKKTTVPYLEMLLIAFLGVTILHLFPESEYKQNDSFYYLKIAEALNKTGQENTYHYSNLYNTVFHGAQPYHYFELWCTAFITRITDFFYNGILTHRFVVSSVFISAVITGLYNLVHLATKQNIRSWHKVFCWALVFFMPDVLTYFPQLAQYLVSNIEGSILERPNFRILYVVLIPVIAENLSERPRVNITCFWLLVLAIISFKFTVLVIPALFLAWLYNVYFKKERQGLLYFWYATGFAVCFAAFYLVFGIDQLPSFYETSINEVTDEILKHWKFVLYSIVASFIYILIIAAIFLVLLVKPRRDAKALAFLLKRNSLLIIVALSGIIAARILFIKDNAYQFLFAAHIIMFILLWLVAVYALVMTPVFRWLLACFLFAIPFLLKIVITGNAPDIFKQNGQYVYEGRQYSREYLADVTRFFKANPGVKGSYLADSNFYARTYYSRRNPNVYFLPVTYIISRNVNGNIDFCISDSASIMTGISNPVHKDYLQSAIQRSLFYQYRKQHSALSLDEVRANFIQDHNLSYLFVTPGVLHGIDSQKIALVYKDIPTGEQLIVFKP